MREKAKWMRVFGIRQAENRAFQKKVSFGFGKESLIKHIFYVDYLKFKVYNYDRSVRIQSDEIL